MVPTTQREEHLPPFFVNCSIPKVNCATVHVTGVFHEINVSRDIANLMDSSAGL